MNYLLLFTKKLLLLVFLIVSIISCRHAPPVPEGASTEIKFVTVINDSPYWESIAHQWIPALINKYARYQLISTYDLPYELHFRLVRATGYQSGYNFNFAGQARTLYRSMIEVEATLYGPAGVELWKWSGWADHKSPQHAMASVGKLLVRAMMDDGLLSPDYYNTNF